MTNDMSDGGSSNPVRHPPDDWLPKETVKPLEVQVAYTDDRIHFRFRWDQPDPGGWLHDMLVYRDGRWQRFADPSPWIAKQNHDDHTGFYEDRLSFLLDDGSVRGFEQFGGWLTAHLGMRTLPGEASEDEVQAHDHYGSEGLDKTDIRKYIPQACAGEWWENDWQTVRPEHELETLKADGVFLDLPMWRAHRSNPRGYGTDHHVLDYRHGDQGRNTFTTQDWDEDDGPEYMWDPAVVDGGALDYGDISQGNFPDQQDGVYALEEEDMVPFDPDVAEWEGAMIPRRPLQEPEGSAADWQANGIWENGEWTVEMWRDLQTDHPADTTQLEAGEVYTWTPAVHHGSGQRWHWVGYPYTLGLGVEPDPITDAVDSETTGLVAESVAGKEPDWDTLETRTLPLLYPGLLDWTKLTSEDHPRVDEIRDSSVSMWDLYEKGPESFLE